MGLGTGGGRSGVGGGGGGFVPGTGSGSPGGGSLTNDDRARGEVDDLEKRQDTDCGQHREESADDVGRKPVTGEDGEAQQQQDDGHQDVREVNVDFQCSPPYTRESRDPNTIVELHACASARSRSEIRSATSSMPTEMRTRPSATPCARRVSAGMEACVITAGSSINDSTPPRLSASVKSWVRSTTRRAGSSPPLTSKEIMPPKPDIWRWASSRCGFLGEPG